jgi:hypothetical protein
LDLFFFAGAEEERYRAAFAAKLLTVFAEGAILTHKLEALRALRKPEHLRCLLALETDCHCKTKVYQTAP